MSLTMADIARMANTSTATISRVLSGKPGVSQAKRGEILNLLDRLGYRPNRVAQNLALGKSSLFGVVVSNLQIPFYAQLIGTLENSCAEYGYGLLVVDSNHDPEREERNIETMREHQVDGLFIIPVYEYDTSIEIDHLLRLKLEKFPFTLIGKVVGYDLDWVAAEETNAAAETACFLLRHGHRRIGFLGCDPGNRTVVERIAGIHAALTEAGVEFDESNVVEEVGTWVNGGLDSWSPEISRVFSKKEYPTAIIAANDTIALIAIRNLERMGYNVPGDVSVVGFDNSDFSALIQPSITTNAKDMGEVARIATEALIAKVKNPQRKSEQHEVPQRLIERESSGPSPAKTKQSSLSKAAKGS
jgi:LacI family transcriptional regulator, galactose operon repressor